MERNKSDEDSGAEITRRTQLGRLLPLWPHEIADGSIAGQQRICQMLSAALRRERQRGVAGHWSYDVSRHAALSRALAPELKRYARMTAAAGQAVVPPTAKIAQRPVA